MLRVIRTPLGSQFLSKLVQVGMLSLLALTHLVGCSTDDKKADTPDGAYSIAEEFDKEERFEEALKRYQEVKNKFPYSRFATMAELAMAEVYFKQESFAEAQVSYQAFRELHPKHPKIDYVTFRLGLSYFKQLPDTTDRDLTLANNAIQIFDEFLKRYPKSEFTTEATDYRNQAYKMLAEKEVYIADFYFKKEKYESALSRYLDMLERYSGHGFDAHSMKQAALCSLKLGYPDKAKKLYQSLKSKFPDSDEERTLRREIE